jgi:hypothetical protein
MPCYCRILNLGKSDNEDFKLAQTVQETLSGIFKNQNWDISGMKKKASTLKNY